MLYRCIVLCFLALNFCLSGCSLMTRYYGASYDGAPDFDVDVSQIPDAVPRDEPKPRFCNPSHYRVAGKTYSVLKTAKNYHAQGIASWYGTRFYKGKTSSGEPYNMLAMTAAHRSLPIPSYVRVTNRVNHRQVVVKINDRGPFKPGRVIDLSYVAAKKLGITNKGTAPVDIRVVEPEDTDVNMKSVPSANGLPKEEKKLDNSTPKQTIKRHKRGKKKSKARVKHHPKLL